MTQASTQVRFLSHWKRLYTVKEAKTKRYATEWEKIFAYLISDKRLVSKMSHNSTTTTTTTKAKKKQFKKEAY